MEAKILLFFGQCIIEMLIVLPKHCVSFGFKIDSKDQADQYKS